MRYFLCARKSDKLISRHMTKNQNGNTAPAPSPATLVHNSRPVPARVWDLLQPQDRTLPPQYQSNGRPEWVRSPKQGVEFYTGFSRARLYQGAADGDFRSVSIRKPGQVKGTRLFHLQSILDFIAKCEQQAEVKS